MSKGWLSEGLVEWRREDRAFLSVVFSWRLSDAYQRAVWMRQLGYAVHAGGPAVDLNPEYLSEVAHVGGRWPGVIGRHNPDACFTTRGCIRSCPFCAVPRIEGQFRELDLKDVQLGPIVCDNNLLASSRRHFDLVIDGLKEFRRVDFNQGLDARLLTRHHADRLAELNLYAVRLAFDNTAHERKFLAAYQKLRKAGIPARRIRVYVLIGFDDTPQDALYRLELVRSLGSLTNPMRYQPLDAERRNQYVGDNWTDAQLKRYMRYFSRLRWLGHIPFERYRG